MDLIARNLLEGTRGPTPLDRRPARAGERESCLGAASPVDPSEQ